MNETGLEITEKIETQKNCQKIFLKTAVALTSTANQHSRIYMMVVYIYMLAPYLTMPNRTLPAERSSSS